VKAQHFVSTVISSVALAAIVLTITGNSFAQSKVVIDDTPFKKAHDSARRAPLRLLGNKDLPLSAFHPQEFFVKMLAPGAVLESSEIIQYSTALRKYSHRESGQTSISPERMVAVVAANFPKGLRGERADYSSARVVFVRDALTGAPISYEIKGKMTRSPKLYIPQKRRNSANPQ
jgi:hypothetical protein